MVSMAAVGSPHPHLGHGGPPGRVRAHPVDVHHAEPGHRPGRVPEGPASDVWAVERRPGAAAGLPCPEWPPGPPQPARL